MSSPSTSAFVLRSGLGRSQGQRVVGALLKVQDKLNQLETQLQDANGAEAVNDENLESELRGVARPTGPVQVNATPTLHAVNTRLTLIEQKLDLMTELLLGNLSDLRLNNERKQSIQQMRYQICDENLRRNLMKRQLQDVLYNVCEDYDYLNE